MDTDEFKDLLQRVRDGDDEAAALLIQHYEPALRRYVRLYLTDPHLREVLDSLDICQSILGAFFVRMASGQFDLEHPNQLVKLLATMARNKIYNHARSGWRKLKSKGEVSTDADKESVHTEPDPAEKVTHRELLQKVHQAFPPEDRIVLQQRLTGFTWVEIAARISSDPDTIRKRFDRTLNRIVRELGLHEVFLD